MGVGEARRSESGRSSGPNKNTRVAHSPGEISIGLSPNTVWPSEIIRSLAEASEVTRPWRILNISHSSSDGLSSGRGNPGVRVDLRGANFIYVDHCQAAFTNAPSVRVGDAGHGQKWPSVG